MLALVMFGLVCVTILAGYPVALTLSGVALLVAGVGALFGWFDPIFLQALPARIFGVLTNPVLLAVPLFVFMGLMLERSKIAADLLAGVGGLLRGLRGGDALAVVLVGALLAASTGIVGATVVTLGLLALPTMLARGVKPALAGGTICAAGTLGQIIPPSIVLVLLGDVLANAYQVAQTRQGNFAPDTVSVAELFAGALLPGAVLVLAYAAWVVLASRGNQAQLSVSEAVSDATPAPTSLGVGLVAPLLLMVLVLGSILSGWATPTEAAAVGAVGAMALAGLRRRLQRRVVREVCQHTLAITAMVFLILVGATVFALVFRGLGGDELVHRWLADLPGGALGAVLLVMLAMFLLGFVLDFIEIVFVVVPIVAPPLLYLGVDPVWLGIMLAINLQTSFLTPPFGFSLFYLRGATGDQLSSAQLYRGVLPFIAIQLLVLLLLVLLPGLATWLPASLYA
jgi:tripartite ATP-independent transporter DctM subunit